MSLSEREKAFENKFAYDEQLRFRVEARAVKLFGLWLAEQIGLSTDEAHAYAADLVAENLKEPGLDDVKRAVFKDIQERNLEISEHMIDVHLEKFFGEAKLQIRQEVNQAA